ncbi:hypothetical protein MMC31_007470, partial [Peltigera leucophlebia]|nr:hypothetical protein [Peltigera leucophlebia]
MDLAWKRIFVGALAGTALTQLAPRSSGYKPPLSPVPVFLVLFFALLILAFTWKAILYPKLFSSIRHLPRPSGGSFLNGQFHVINRDPDGFPFQKWINETPNDGLIYYRFLFNAERILVTSPKTLAEVLVHKNYDFIKPELIVKGVGRILGVGVLLAEGDEHKMQRKNLMPAFHYRHVKDLYAIFWSKSRELAEAVTKTVNEKDPAQEIEDGPVVEMGNWASRATLDIIGLAGMGQDFNSLQNPNTELNRTYQTIFGSPRGSSAALLVMAQLFPIWILHRLPLRQNYQIAAASTKIRSICRELINSKKERMSAQKDSGVDILSVALESGGFTDENLVDQMMTFLAAGHETTARAMLWAIHTLARHPDIQSRLRAEIR